MLASHGAAELCERVVQEALHAVQQHYAAAAADVDGPPLLRVGVGCDRGLHRSVALAAGGHGTAGAEGRARPFGPQQPRTGSAVAARAAHMDVGPQGAAPWGMGGRGGAAGGPMGGRREQEGGTPVSFQVLECLKQ